MSMISFLLTAINYNKYIRELIERKWEILKKKNRLKRLLPDPEYSLHQ